MTFSGDTDVAIIGGGPAGATAALVLARAGLRATVLERARFPRFHVGESLLPYHKELLRRLGLEEAVAGRGYVVKRGAFFVSNDGAVERHLDFGEFLDEPFCNAWEVERADFDELLLRRAGEAGAAVLEEHTATGAAGGAGAWELGVRGPGGEAGTLRARWLLDASGQSAWGAHRLGVPRRPAGLEKVALFTHYRGGRRRPGRHGGDIQLVFGDGCWFWWIPLRDDVVSVGCVTDRARWQAEGGDPEGYLDRRLGTSPLLVRQLEGAERVRPAHVAADYSYRAERVTGDGWALIGDAAAFLDPIFSTGVLLAMKSGDRAARCLLPALAAGRTPTARDLAPYRRAMRRWTGSYFELIRAFYHPGFAPVFFTPRRAYQRAMAPFLAGRVELSPWQRLHLRLFYWIVRLNGRWGFVPDPRPAGATAHHA